MKKERAKGFITGMLVMAVCVGLVGTAAATVGRRTAELDYSDIKITLNGQTVTPTDGKGNVLEPFAIDGITYLPVRAAGNLAGLNVDWDGKTNTVLLADKGAALAESYGDTKVPRLERVVGREPFYNEYAENGGAMRYRYDIALFSEAALKSYATDYDTILKAAGFAFSEKKGTNDDITMIYKSTKLKEQVSLFLAEEDGRNFVTVKIEAILSANSDGKGDSSATAPSGGGNGSSGGTTADPDAENRAQYEKEKAALDAKYVPMIEGSQANYDAAVENYDDAVKRMLPGSVVQSLYNTMMDRKDTLEGRQRSYDESVAALQSKYGI